MKATELMIGDWVHGLYPNGSRYANPFRISTVDIYPLNRSPRIVTNGGYGFHEEHLEPISLTPEILEKNGFEKEGIKLIAREGVYYIDIIDCGTEFKVIDENIIIHFVHELQHALRLCGLTDLADNFKV